ncbi:MAG TPA: DUF3014 domain-containing protein [Xanthomonadales bacterium]|nr:DUF3014 domain-containing protein [Xanthomonadales bacterium]
MKQKPNQEGKTLWVILPLVIVIAAAIYYFFFFNQQESVPAPIADLIPEKTVPVEPEPEPQRPALPEVQPDQLADTEDAIEEALEAAEPLPELAESDDEALAAAAAVMGETPARNYLVPESFISKLVATVDSLTRDEIPGNIVPVRGPGGEMQATSDGETEEVNPETGLREPLFILDPVNFQRYTAQVEVLEAIDTAQLAENYMHYYPLLQQSYRELGYAEGEFSDRLLEVIDDLLDTPEPDYPVRLTKPEAFYEFVDPELEGLSAGQKLIVRMGPSNAARVKEKLREIRAAIQTQRE